MLWNFHLVDSKCFQIKFITNKFFFTGRCHFQLSNIRIAKRFNQWNIKARILKMYSRSAKGGEKGDPNRNPWLAKMGFILIFRTEFIVLLAWSSVLNSSYCSLDLQFWEDVLHGAHVIDEM
jgi:hypothetical protein